VECNRHACHFMMQGNIDLRTGLPVTRYEQKCLVGSELLFHTVKVTRNFAESIRKLSPCVDEAEVANHDEGEDPQVDEMKRLSKAIPSRTELDLAAKKLQTLEQTKATLKLSHDRLQTVELSYEPDGLLMFKLESGTRSASAEGTATWRIMVPDDTKPIPMSSLSSLRFKLGEIPMCNPFGPLYTSPPAFVGNVFVLKYGKDISAHFQFHKIDLGHGDAGNLTAVIYQMLLDPTSTATTNQTVTMRLVAFEINIAAIKDRLDALGIYYGSEENVLE
jgi:hypothetical protein